MNSVNDIPGTVIIDGSVYAVNLLWGQAKNAEEVPAELRKSMALIGSRLYLESDKSGENQFAVGDKSLGHKRGMVSLVSTIGHDGRAVCALLPSDDALWILFGIDRNGNVLFDKAFTSKDDAQRYFDDYVHYYTDWDIVYSSDDAGYGIPAEPGELIRSKGKKIKEKGLIALVPVVGIGIGVILIAGVLFNLVNWWLDEQEKEIVFEAKPVIQERFESIRAPWSGKSQPISLITQCKAVMAQKRLLASSVPGWMPEEKVSCTDNEITYKVDRKGGLDLWMLNAGSFFKADDMPTISDIQGDSAFFSWRLNTKDYPLKNLGEGDLPRISDAVRYLKRGFSSSFMDIKLGSPEVSPERGDIKIVKFSFSLSRDPLFVMPLFEQINGMVLNKINYDFRTGKWNVEGQFWGVG